MQLNQCAQIAASLPLLRVQKGARVPQSKIDVVAAATPLPFTLRELDVVPELAPATPAAHTLPSAPLPAQQQLRYAVVEFLLLQLLLLQHMWHLLSLLLPFQRCLRCGRIDHLRLAAIATHVRLIAGALHQLPHGAGLGHGVGDARCGDGIHEARFAGVCGEREGRESDRFVGGEIVRNTPLTFQL